MKKYIKITEATSSLVQHEIMKLNIIRDLVDNELMSHLSYFKLNNLVDEKLLDELLDLHKKWKRLVVKLMIPLKRASVNNTKTMSEYQDYFGKDIDKYIYRGSDSYESPHELKNTLIDGIQFN